MQRRVSFSAGKLVWSRDRENTNKLGAGHFALVTDTKVLLTLLVSLVKTMVLLQKYLGTGHFAAPHRLTLAAGSEI